MEHVYQLNGFPFFNEQDIKLRRFLEDYFATGVREALLTENGAWKFHQIEAPLLTPAELINSNYTNEDVWFQEQTTNYPHSMVLRPETTPGSYAYAKHLLSHQEVMPPFCVWQAGKSFRKEMDQPTKHCRFKEFYQQEFQCLYATTTSNDYQAKLAPKVEQLVATMLKLPTRLVDSDRLPAYSKRTIDVEVNNGDKWMEVCSISVRTDFDTVINRGTKVISFLVLEIALGLDRCLYNFNPPQDPQ